jgi:tetrahydrodipicolinate N-succinyltransferase
MLRTSPRLGVPESRPVEARPVIIADGAFVGSRAIVVEGVVVEEEAVLAAAVLTASTRIIDVTAAVFHAAQWSASARRAPTGRRRSTQR